MNPARAVPGAKRAQAVKFGLSARMPVRKRLCLAHARAVASQKPPQQTPMQRASSRKHHDFRFGFQLVFEPHKSERMTAVEFDGLQHLAATSRENQVIRQRFGRPRCKLDQECAHWALALFLMNRDAAN